MFDNLLRVAEAKKIEIDRERISHDAPLLKNRIKARIARSIWGNTEFYQVALQLDKQYSKALGLFPEAARVSARGKS
jgi:hypothetical protein